MRLTLSSSRPRPPSLRIPTPTDGGSRFTLTPSADATNSTRRFTSKIPSVHVTHEPLTGLAQGLLLYIGSTMSLCRTFLYPLSFFTSAALHSIPVFPRLFQAFIIERHRAFITPVVYALAVAHLATNHYNFSSFRTLLLPSPRPHPPSPSSFHTPLLLDVAYLSHTLNPSPGLVRGRQ